MQQVYDEIMTPEQAAKYLGLKPTTLGRWRWEGKGPKYAKMGESKFAHVRYRKSFLDDFLSKSEIHP